MGMHGPRISLNRFAGRRMRMNRAQTLDYENRSGDLPPICGESLKVLVAFERSHWPIGRPDVIAVTKSRKVIEVECKITAADFRANKEKRTENFRRECGLYCPHQFYYMVPPTMVEVVKSEVEDGYGLMTYSEKLSRWSKLPSLEIAKPAKINHNADALGVRDIVKLVMAQSGTLVSLSRDLCRL